MLELRNLSKIFPDKKLFENVNLSFAQGNTYGIIGANGAGKSTLLKIISGEVSASSGTVLYEPTKRISTLSQDTTLFDEEMVTQTVIAGNHLLMEIEKEKNAIYENVNATEEDYVRASKLEDMYGEAGGWSAEQDAQNLLSNLGVPKHKWEVQMKELKANEKVKVLLARALFGKPDILIMDEPTNRLDLAAIKWLENFLIDYPNVVLVVSHDSAFLDAVCTHVVDIDYGKAELFVGNYSFWKESSQLALELKRSHNLKKEEQIAKLKEFIAKFSANASKSGQATSRKKALEKIVLDEIKPSNRRYPFIKFELFRTPGKQILEVKNLSAKDASGNYLFKNLSFVLQANKKMILIGEDDLAKTKLLDILAGVETEYEGEVLWGSTIKYSYFPVNHSSFFNTEENLLDWLSQYPLQNTIEEWRDNSNHKMRSYLGRMLFGSDAVFKKVNVTSGGEKARLMFTKMMLQESNFLIMDQPLDHLDTESIDSVIEALVNYKSAVIVATYNKALISKVADVILNLKPENSTFFLGNLEEYESRMQN